MPFRLLRASVRSTSPPSEVPCQSGSQLEPGLQLVHRGLNVRAVLVGVALDHRQRFVAADPLHGGQVNTGLDKMGDRGVAQGVPKNLIRV